MARNSIDKGIRRAILDARRIVQESEKADCNEAETRRRIERIFESIMGYDAFKHLSRERAVRGAGETEHVDFAVQAEEGEDVRPTMMVEIKRVAVDLAPKHLKQVTSYAINAGCEWVVLTNSKVWKLYHISFGQPPVTKLITSWNIIDDDVAEIAKNFDLISLKSIKKGVLEELWQRTNTLHPKNLLQAILCESSVRVIRRELRKSSGVFLSPEDIVSGVRRILNEGALAELGDIRLSLSEKKTQRKRKKKETKPDANESESSLEKEDEDSEL